MRKDEFAMVLQGAVAGRHEELEKLLRIYAPLIHKYSCDQGQFDEDLHQYLLIHIALNISKFPL